MWYFLNLYLQQVLGYGAFASGAALLPMTIFIMVSMVVLAPRLIGRFGPKPLIVAGPLVLAAGLVFLSLARPEEGGLASGLVNTSFQVGSAIGLAAVSALAVSQGTGQLGDPQALTDGFSAGFLAAAGIAVAGALLALLTIRQPRSPEPTPVEPDQAPVQEPALSAP